MSIEEFQKGERLTAAKLNEIVKMLNAALRGDGIITVNTSSNGTATIGLNVNALLPRIPKERSQRILWGKPQYDWTTGTTITLYPCEINGDEVILEDGYSVYVQRSKASYTMPHSTKIAAGDVLPFVYANDGHYYLLGRIVESVTDFRVDTTSHKLQIKSQAQLVWVAGTESDWQDIHTGDTC